MWNPLKNNGCCICGPGQMWGNHMIWTPDEQFCWIAMGQQMGRRTTAKAQGTTVLPPGVEGYSEIVA